MLTVCRKNSKKRHNRTSSVRLSLNITIIYGTLTASVPVAVVHISSKQNCKKHYTEIIIAYFCDNVKWF